jgi:hypothetical protein
MAAFIYVTKYFLKYNMCTGNFESGFSLFSLILFLLFLASFYFSHFLSSSDRTRFNNYSEKKMSTHNVSCNIRNPHCSAYLQQNALVSDVFPLVIL